VEVVDSRERPDAEAIRRALGECMTLADIDDAMGWSPGTARRRRWRNHQRGGLPPSDAEIGGVPLWFRATIQQWNPPKPTSTTAPRRSPQPEAARQPPPQPPAQEPDVVSDVPVLPAPDREPGVTTGSNGHTGADKRAEPTTDTDEPPVEPSSLPAGPDAHTAGPIAAEPAQGAVVDPDEPSTPTGSTGAPLSEVAAEGVPVGTGFELSPGQPVIAYVHRAWREAKVRGRDRGTVVVDYHIDDTPLGARQQRINIDRVRLCPTGDKDTASDGAGGE
jgi:hypothetical protein